MKAFCGYPVNGKPCGNLATPGCAFCDSHGWEFTENNIRRGRKISSLLTPLTEEQIIDRAAERRRGIRFAIAYLWCVAATLALVWLVPAALRFVQEYRQVWLGILIGSVLQTAMIMCSKWLGDRVGWLEWFSWN